MFNNDCILVESLKTATEGLRELDELASNSLARLLANPKRFLKQE